MAVLRVSSRWEIPDDELLWRFSRSSGSGGQHVNTSDSRVELSFDIADTRSLSPTLRDRVLANLANRAAHGVITVTASEHRSQWRNRQEAERRLVALLIDAVAPPPKPRRATKPSFSARRARVEGKRQRGEVKRLRQPPDE